MDGSVRDRAAVSARREATLAPPVCDDERNDRTRTRKDSNHSDGHFVGKRHECYSASRIDPRGLLG